MRIATNLQSSLAIRKLDKVNETLDKEHGRLSSGDRILQASYDPAGLAISENMKAKTRSLGQAKRNINDGISFFQMTEGNFNVLQSTAIRLRELAVQASSEAYGRDQRQMLSKEFESLKAEIKRITDGAVSNIFGSKERQDIYEIQIGIKGNRKNDRLTYNVNKFFDTDQYYGTKNLSVFTKENAQSSLSGIDGMIEQLAGGRAELGSYFNKLLAAEKGVDNYNLNLETAKSKIRDTDIAKSSMNKATASIVQNATSAMLSQANSNPKTVLKLLS